LKQLTLAAAFGIKKRGRPKRASLPTDLIKKKEAPKKPKVASQNKKRKTLPVIATKPLKGTVKRTNWGTGSNLQILKKAVGEWKNKTGRYFDSNSKDPGCWWHRWTHDDGFTNTEYARDCDK
jgi:hypothetical protein